MSTSIVPDLHRAECFAIHSTDPVFLSQIPDLLCRALSEPGDLLSVHALHSAEQDGTREGAYLQERQVIGPHVTVDVYELARPRQRNVVWIDRYHLIAPGAQPIVAGMLLGLYAGGEGTITLMVHHPTSIQAVESHLYQLPHGGATRWDDPMITSQCRYAVHCSQQQRGVVHVACTPLLVAPALQAIQSYSNF
jgi:hypothetical protein